MNHNFYPELPLGQHISYLWRAKTTKIWEESFKRGECNPTQSLFWKSKPVIELYDMLEDPWEVNNLAEKKEYHEIKSRLLTKLKNHVIQTHDASFIPESELIRLNEQSTIFDYTHSEQYPIKKIVDIAFASATGDKMYYRLFKDNLNSPNVTVRYWSLLGLSRISENNSDFMAILLEKIKDDNPDIALLAARELYRRGEIEPANKVFSKFLNHELLPIKLIAINYLQQLGDSAFLSFEEELTEIRNNNKPDNNFSFTLYIDDIIRDGLKRARK